MRIIFWLVLVVVAPYLVNAQLDYVYIDSISVLGNQKTRKSIILREMLVSQGDTVGLANLSALMDRSEELIMNTGLFNQAEISFKAWEGSTNKIHLLVRVEEAWYLYPVPIFELADRNFNVWWVEQGRSLQRLNFGMEFAHLNFSGNRDRLKISAKYGYTRKYAISYSLPFFNKAQTLGLSAEAAFLRNREINYATAGNKQEFFRDGEDFIYQRFHSDLALNYRPRINASHGLILGYRQNRVDDIIVHEKNPDFFLDGRSFQRYFLMAYRFTYDNRDVRPYPWKGSYFNAVLEKDGLGIFPDRNALTLWTSYRRYLPFGERWSLGMEANTKYSFIRSQQPYNDNRAMGFGNHYLHGYEYYIMDGLDMLMGRSSLRFHLWEWGMDFGKAVPIKAFQKMPVRLYLSLNNDLGYAHDPYTGKLNDLSNRPLWGGGIGLDIVLYYDKVIQIEYSFNDLLENGLFLHLNLNI
ncbi:MAG: BamA/TamA family outer membrane protein [Phaeodactylibacter sp.]|nr:BamA/TamA family outer membrane protein [Phaeodactylibacter sp.]MCB9052923.1 BamA/TamA family outer membrane protein [Lewinellaceae bacterium]